MSQVVVGYLSRGYGRGLFTLIHYEAFLASHGIEDAVQSWCAGYLFDNGL